jgi:hypothetical protein
MGYAVPIAILCCGLLLQPSVAQQKGAAPPASKMRPVALRPIPDEAVRQNARLAAGLSPSAKSKVMSAAAALAATAKQQPAMTADQLQGKARAAAVQAFPNLSEMDVDAVVFVVMMQCAQDEQSDLQQTMNTMQQNSNGKQALRGAQQSDSTSDMSQELQMRLQMQMQQQTQLERAMSNMMKSVADTQSSILANLK